jgi:hypothetical protein
MHQKQPPAKVAVSANAFGIGGAGDGESSASDDGVQAKRLKPRRPSPRSIVRTRGEVNMAPMY